ncbi:MAG: hypothetical protein B6I19_05020 [Bacteroidetes bacterium 4572_114]|nr:MAG: hypothetical protein B6I19_05020 [Bacteroidetes bacterium 4572_114]
MKKIILVILATLSGYFTYGQIGEINCVSCSDNYINFTNFASGIGTDNRATGNRSFVGGMGSDAQGNYSIAFGYRAYAGGTNSISLGYTSNAIGMYSVAIGRQSYANGPAAFALGLASNAQAESSYVFGEFLKATASGTVTIGHGAGTGENYLLNEIPNSLMMGINSNLPTFFISESDGYGTTGTIGIGNITAPLAKLHIKSDDGEDATLFLQPTDWDNNFAELRIGTTGHSIKAEKEIGLSFASENNFIFENGNVGIGTTSPAHPLQVNGNLMISNQDGSLLFQGDDKGEWGEWGIEYESGGLNFWKPYGSNNFGNYFLFLADDGNVGIGTEDPAAKLDVCGDIRFTGQLYDAEGLFEPSPWEKDAGGIFYSSGNVGIGTSEVPTEKLEVEGNINFTGNLLQDGEPFETSKWGENESAQIFYNNGNVGIGTEEPAGLLSLYKNNPDENLGISFENGGSTKYWIGHNGGDNVFYLGGIGGTTPGLGAINILGGNVGIGNNNPGKALDVNGDINFTGDLYDNGQLIDINLWEENTEGIHYNLGNVGIGTNIPEAPLHINSNIWDTDAEFIKVENNGVNGSGTTIIGKQISGGPVII